jgi:lysophospholipase L1-like esterase
VDVGPAAWRAGRCAAVAAMLVAAGCAGSQDGGWPVMSGLDADAEGSVDGTTTGVGDGTMPDGDGWSPSPDAGADATAVPEGGVTNDAAGDADASDPGDADGGAPADAVDDMTAPADRQPPSWAPCPARGTACAIMPLGDSITYGYLSSDFGGYRKPLFQKALADHRTITFVGSQTSGPTMVAGVPFPRHNEGHSGYTIDTGGGRMGLLPVVQSGVVQTYRPNIVTLMIGTNDVDIQLDLPNAPARLATLVDTILSIDSNLLLVVAQIIPTQTDSETPNVTAYNAAMPSMVASRAAQGKHIVLVDMYSPFVADSNYKSDYLANNLHPNDAGFVVMADVWYSAIGSYFH